MKKQRPTIPLADWKLAIHLAATHEVQSQICTPEYRRDSDFSSIWEYCSNSIFPEELQNQLKRLGITLDKPSDFYWVDRSEGSFSIRVVYFVVGKILAGPNQWKEDETGEILMYRTLRETPYLSLIVFPQNQYFGEAPTYSDSSAGDLIRIDFRLEIPKKLIDSNSKNS